MLERPTMKLQYQLPQVYGNLLPKDILQFEPQEFKATCDNCLMSQDTTKSKIKYKADLKCCTFHPFVPNYMVGATFLDESMSAGQAVFRGKIERREYALPIGMVAPVKFQVEFNNRTEGEFGNRQDWLCPYYDRQKNNCQVWRNRGVVCTTFYCESSYGKLGINFWEKLNNYLWYIELALLEEALAMLDFSPRQVMELLDYHNRFEGSAAELKSGTLTEKKARELWNGYYEDQEGFYKKSYEVVSNISRTDFFDLLGEQGESLADELYSIIPQLKEKNKA